jgi:hypothetical protein
VRKVAGKTRQTDAQIDRFQAFFLVARSSQSRSSRAKTAFLRQTSSIFFEIETQDAAANELNFDNILLQNHQPRNRPEKEGLLRGYSSDKVSPAVERRH